MVRSLGLCAAIVVIAFLGAPANAETFRAELVEHSGDAGVNEASGSMTQIQGVHFNADSVQILSDLAPGGVPVARVEGQFDREDWNLIYGAQYLAQSTKPNQTFHFNVLLSGPVTPFEIRAIGPRGEVESETLSISVSNWPDVIASLRKPEGGRRPFTLGASLTHLTLTQTGIPDFSENALTLKGAYSTVLSPKWTFGTNLFFTALPFGSNLSGYEARFFGLNARVGYRLPFASDPWEFFIFGGVYYTTMFVTNNAFGYQNEAGPQLYPTIRRVLKNGDSLSAYFKYSPVTDGSTALSAGNHEIAVGAAWSREASNHHFYSINLDVAQVHLNFPDLGSEVQSSSLSLGMSYGL